MTGQPYQAKLFWQQLLALMAKRRVIPVVGPATVVIDGELGCRPLMEYLARWVEEVLDLEPHPDTTLNDVACRYMRTGEPMVYVSPDGHNPRETMRSGSRRACARIIY